MQHKRILGGQKNLGDSRFGLQPLLNENPAKVSVLICGMKGLHCDCTSQCHFELVENSLSAFLLEIPILSWFLTVLLHTNYYKIKKSPYEPVKLQGYICLIITGFYLPSECNMLCKKLQVLSWLIAFHTLPHNSGGLLWFHVGCPCTHPSVCASVCIVK